MAYCLKCGAYIPDGQSICLACGYDPAAEQKAAEEARKKANAGNQAYQYSSSQSNQELRKRLEEQRRRTQEQNRQWAEQEKTRREEQAAREAARKEQQERDRAWAREEYERRQEEERARVSRESVRSTGSDYSRNSSVGEGNKALAALSYLSVLFALPYIFTPQDEYAKFHAKQGMKLFLFGIFADILTSFIGFGWIATLARLYLIYKGMSNALNGRKEPLPYIGTIGEK